MKILNIPCLSDTQIIALVECAEQTALRFSSPVYLVGSAVASLYPNDIDIFVAVKRETYLRLFTNYNRKTESKEDHEKNILDMKIQQAKIYRKQKEYFENKIKGWDFDVKFQNVEQFIQHTSPRMRLDYAFNSLW